ncbi:hypothetical protein ABZ700_15145 [Streptomyces diastaticus]|uniref:hypothetical protein n=1 Tax=Streptomyces diastaticus TaxID=1956 RepID=UPI0033CF93F8
MACACKNKRQTYEVVPNAGRANRPAFTSSSRGTAEAVADRYPTSVVRDKKTGDAVYHAWPKGAYEVVVGDRVVLPAHKVRNDADKGPLRAAADERAADGAVVRAVDSGAVVYPLMAALTASGATLTAEQAPTPA